jgi:uncharacterized membrane protein YozB (DUF420 family)
MSLEQPKTRTAPWLIALLLMLVSAIPVGVGINVIVELTAGHVRPETIRHIAWPSPVVLHVLAAAAFATLGALQFVAAFRHRFPGWHRGVGRVLMICGLIAGLSGMWMALFYQRLPDTNDLLFAIRLVFSSAMLVFIVLGFAAIRRRNLPQHRAWMMRAYAIGLGAGTQALVFMVAEGVAGAPDQVGKALLMGAAWLINLATAELVVRRGRQRHPVQEFSANAARSALASRNLSSPNSALPNQQGPTP